MGKSYKSVYYQLLFSINVYILIPQGILYFSFKKKKPFHSKRTIHHLEEWDTATKCSTVK